MLRVAGGMWVEPPSQAERSRAAVAISVNFRDVGTVRNRIQHCRVYRSSQLVSTNELSRLGIKTVLDLRRPAVLCKSHHHNIRSALRHGVLSCLGWCTWALRRREAGRGEVVVQRRELPEPCWRCTEACHDEYGVSANVFHGEASLALSLLFQNNTCHPDIHIHPQPCLVCSHCSNVPRRQWTCCHGASPSTSCGSCQAVCRPKCCGAPSGASSRSPLWQVSSTCWSIPSDLLHHE